MDKQLFLQYVEMINKFEAISKAGAKISPSVEESNLMKKIKELYAKNEEYQKLIKKIHSLPPEERKKAVEAFFSRENSKGENAKKEEEVISNTFGVDISKIRHQYLDNGNEIFTFSNPKTGQEIILENNKRGKPLVERLEELQKESEQFQTEDYEANSNNILMDQRNNSNVELDMLTKDEISEKYGRIANMSDEDFRKLQYLLTNYEKLGIKGINMDNLIYLDENNQVHEVVVNDNQEIVVATPDEASYSGSEYEGSAEEEKVEEEAQEDVVEGMVEEGEADTAEEVKEEVEGQREKKGNKVLTYTKEGFADVALFASVSVFVILVFYILYFLIKYYLF